MLWGDFNVASSEAFDYAHAMTVLKDVGQCPSSFQGDVNAFAAVWFHAWRENISIDNGRLSKSHRADISNQFLCVLRSRFIAERKFVFRDNKKLQWTRGSPIMIEEGRSAPSKVLLAEDNVLLAIMIEEELEACGFTIVGPVASNAQALDCLSRTTPDVAVLDFQLLDGPSFETAHELKRRRVPFLVLSGYVEAPSEYAGVPWLRKPQSPSVLVRALRGMLANSGEFHGVRERVGRLGLAGSGPALS